MIIPVVILKVLALAMEGTVTLNPQTSPIKSNTPKPEASTAHDARMSTDMHGSVGSSYRNAPEGSTSLGKGLGLGC